MKTKIILSTVAALVVGAVLGALVASWAWHKQKARWMVGIELDRVLYSYAPLQSLEKGKLDDAKAVLLSHLEDGLIYYDKATRGFPEFGGTNVVVIVNAKALYDTLLTKKTTEPAHAGDVSTRAR